ncbi:MAG: hypothetical protein WCF28_01350 [Methanobacterium sp.]|uniref:hypothetical protein n=1 Tax=Methanobacterium sp. TaxID=2164 RepID=UPI003C78CBA7
MDESNVLFIKNRGNSKKSEEKLEVDDKHVTIQSRTGGSVVVNFKGSESELMDISNFFKGVNEVEPLTLNIGGSGEVDHYFRGISEITPKEDGAYKLDVTLQFLSNTV